MPRCIYQSDNLRCTDGAAELVQRLVERKNQQDAALTSPYLWAVADGMGGHPRGEDASRVALTILADQLDGPGTAEQLASAAAAADQAVVALADGGKGGNPGTTLVAVLLDPSGEKLYGLWCGDSRAYLQYPDGQLEQLTTDHANPLGGIEAALGDHARFECGYQPETFAISTDTAGALILATDGLFGPYGTSLGEELAFETALAAGLVTASDRAEKQGSDNITVLRLDFTRLRS